jgi:predicted component of type VI protein secretion system
MSTHRYSSLLDEVISATEEQQAELKAVRSNETCHEVLYKNIRFLLKTEGHSVKITALDTTEQTLAEQTFKTESPRLVAGVFQQTLVVSQFDFLILSSQ